MKTKHRWLSAPALAAALLMGGLISTPSQAELIVNGGFELPIVTNSGPPPGLGFDYLPGVPGWVFTSGKEPLFTTFYNPVAGGDQALQLESLDPIQQMFATTPGGSYLLSFALSAYTNNDILLDLAPTRVMVDGVTADFIGNDLLYQTFVVPFTATGGSTLLSFENIGVFGTNYPQIDNVSVQAIPEPGTGGLAALALTGMVAVGFTRRRKAEQTVV